MNFILLVTNVSLSPSAIMQIIVTIQTPAFCQKKNNTTYVKAQCDSHSSNEYAEQILRVLALTTIIPQTR